MTIGGSILGVLVLILDIWAIITILGSGESPGVKLLWVLLIIALPLIGLIIWLLAGPGSRVHAR